MSKTFYPPTNCLQCDRFGQCYALSLCLDCYQESGARQRRANRKVNFNPFGKGIVYLVTSRWMPGLVKIGSTRAEIAKRLASSSIPDPHVVATWREDAPWALETRLHAALHLQRIPGTEWFQVEPQDVVRLVASWES